MHVIDLQIISGFKLNYAFMEIQETVHFDFKSARG